MSVADLTGQRFGRLIVISQHKAPPFNLAVCRCDCGGEKTTRTGCLTNGDAKSCGCLVTERMVKRNLTHGKSHMPEYWVWRTMIARCTNPNHKSYHHYGGRGIKVCGRWLNSFEAFFEDVGPRPSPKLQIDRPDNEGDYRPGNWKWSTPKENSNNRRRCQAKKLSFVLVEEIRSLAGTATHLALGRRYGVSEAAIQAVLAGRTWAVAA